jgi:hypothetical protein
VVALTREAYAIDAGRIPERFALSDAVGRLAPVTASPTIRLAFQPVKRRPLDSLKFGAESGFRAERGQAIDAAGGELRPQQFVAGITAGCLRLRRDVRKQPHHIVHLP